MTARSRRLLIAAAGLLLAALLAAWPWRHAPLATRPSAPEPAQGASPRAPAALPGSPPPFTNEDQHAYLERQRKAAGMVILRNGQGEPPRPFFDMSLDPASRRARVRAVLRQLSDMRQQVDEASGRRPVPIAGTTAPLLRSNGDDNDKPVEPARK
ncbi:MAG: hypothetical protein KGO96_00520 [Elusimicrobia bacterium]|nr:hypothetical protein [Elusimicrobiota bacterium]MDE2236579.1 hypothetical protein [Elusimicrobiota bacterium]MDE2424378.1 hypothetical protein [Elusimicrobiota bacterium]